jgi:hypothetical protein
MRLPNAGFTQLIRQPTHIQGGNLEYVYANRTNDLEIITDDDAYSCYFCFLVISGTPCTEPEPETDNSINRKPTEGRFLKDRFSVLLILVGFGFHTRVFLHDFLLGKFFSHLTDV